VNNNIFVMVKVALLIGTFAAISNAITL